MGNAVFSFSELLVLLDVDGVPPASAPFPTMEELAPIIGPLRFRMNPPLLPPRANLSASPVAAELSIRQFQIGGADAVWEHIYGWITGYLDDTLTKAPKSAGPPGFRTYKGHGVMVLFSYNKPNGYAEPCFELKVLRDEHPMQTRRDAVRRHARVARRTARL
ncbi:MAG: hypothetical protein HOV81_42150 [Kofleriaceae bacterium]|nr:hypothetical protein [Kofleriaceae bacterium]